MNLKEATFDRNRYEKLVKEFVSNPRNLESIVRDMIDYDAFKKDKDRDRSDWKQMCMQIGIGIAAYVSHGLTVKESKSKSNVGLNIRGMIRNIIKEEHALLKKVNISEGRSLHFTQVVDDRFDKGDLKSLLKSRVDKIKDALSNLDVSIKTGPMRELKFKDSENNTQYRIDFIIDKNSNKVKWDDVYGAINTVKAVPYTLK